MMNLLMQIYVSEKDIPFMTFVKKRFGRNFSRVTIDALKDMLSYEWEEYRKKNNPQQEKQDE